MKQTDYLLLAVGADPEFFVTDGFGGSATAIGKIGGSKHAPLLINDDGFSAIQEDNVMVEFNILPARSAKAFRDNLQLVMEHLEKVLEDKSLVKRIAPSMEFNPAQLEHPQAKAIGCDIDYNAWTMRPNMPLSAEILGNIRTAGGHVHVSYSLNGNQPTEKGNYDLCRMLDVALGVPSVLLDTDDVRRKYYGKAGALRHKPYGIEYRTLSNFWIKSTDLMEWTFSQVRWAIDRLNEAGPLSKLVHDQVQNAINNPDRDLANKLVKSFLIQMP